MAGRAGGPHLKTPPQKWVPHISIPSVETLTKRDMAHPVPGEFGFGSPARRKTL